MLNPHLATILAREHERDLRALSESVSTPRQLDDRHDRPSRREAARLSLRRPVRTPPSVLRSECARALD
jgi:hypothetical protein